MGYGRNKVERNKAWRVIFFDVGNTLLFPNRAKMLAPISNDHHPTLEQWQALERKTKNEFDRSMQTGRVDHGFWWTFHTHLLTEIGQDTAFREELVKNSQNSAHWDQIVPGTRDALQRIRRNFRIAVISNADGGIGRALSRCGIADCFESITDSGIVGSEKPRAESFAAALQSMHTRSEESLYVGDVYSVDYLGARDAGLDAVLLDVAGTYRDRDLQRVESLQQLERWLLNKDRILITNTEAIGDADDLPSVLDDGGLSGGANHGVKAGSVSAASADADTT